jgi:hypothetical protein
MHVIVFFLSCGIYEYLHGDSLVFDAKFSKIIVVFELLLYATVCLFLLGIIVMLYYYPVSFLFYELISLGILLFVVKKIFKQ